MPRKNARPQARIARARMLRKIELSKENNIPLRRRGGAIILGAGATRATAAVHLLRTN